jgi:hypothetical protein
MLEESQVEKQVKGTRKVGIYGSQLVMSVIGAWLQDKPEFDVQRIDCLPHDIIDEPDAAPPDVIFFDLAAAQNHFAISLMRTHPAVMLIGVDLAGKKMLVLSGKQSRFLTEEDLVEAIQAGFQVSP